MIINTFVTHFADITDPRQLGKVDHKLFDIILLMILAVVSGAEGWEDIEMFGEERFDWLKLYGDFDLLYQTRVYPLMIPSPT
ncbi:transposase family protein [Oceanisphaera sp. DM8]|uniref:Transposase family protein n=1 Tax=Oceanisphaera pacifica TaxID=2818389 RepID=A0ABS3NGT0_9GAMM|nr:transposase family protein [Oceanisphaera pacifica]